MRCLHTWLFLALDPENLCVHTLHTAPKRQTAAASAPSPSQTSEDPGIFCQATLLRPHRVRTFLETEKGTFPQHGVFPSIPPLERQIMSRPAKLTLAASVIVSGLTVWGVHYMQEKEREVMYRGVERDEARQAEKRKRQLELQINQEKEAAYQKIQPTAGSAMSSSSSSAALPR